MIVEQAHLLDSNVLVYAFIRQEDFAKRQVAKELVANGMRGGMAVVSAQNLAEFASVALHKHGATLEEVDSSLEELGTFLETSSYSGRTVQLAARLSKAHGIHFYVALIVAVMRERNVGTIVTENDKDFRKIPGLTVINPFTAKPAKTKK